MTRSWGSGEPGPQQGPAVMLLQPREQGLRRLLPASSGYGLALIRSRMKRPHFICMLALHSLQRAWYLPHDKYDPIHSPPNAGFWDLIVLKYVRPQIQAPQLTAGEMQSLLQRVSVNMWETVKGFWSKHPV